MPRVSETLDIHGAHCRITSPAGPLAAAVAQVAEHLGLPQESETAPALAVDVAAGPLPSAPDDAPHASHEDGYLRVWRLDGGAVLRTAHVSITVRPEEGEARCTVSDAEAVGTAVVQELAVGIVFALLLLLRPRGFYPLHAAALAYGAHGLLLVAESDAGKSTTAFRLVRHGWQFLSDDSVLLRCRDGTVEALGFRRTFGLDLDAEGLFPELAAFDRRQPSDAQKRAVPVEALYPEQAASTCRPRVLLFPHIEDRAASVLEPVSKADALIALASQSALITFDPVWTSDHLTMLRSLVHQADAYRLRAGRDLLEDPARILRLLGTVWPDPLPTPESASLADD